LYWDVLSINTATPRTQALRQFQGLRSFPCTGVSDVIPIFYPENPNPKPGNDQFANPLGHPVMLQSSSGGELTLTEARFTSEAGATVDLEWLTAVNDPHKLVQSNEVFLMPTRPCCRIRVMTWWWQAMIRWQATSPAIFNFAQERNRPGPWA
jgi:hypothetical protein